MPKSAHPIARRRAFAIRPGLTKFASLVLPLAGLAITAPPIKRAMENRFSLLAPVFLTLFLLFAGAAGASAQDYTVTNLGQTNTYPGSGAMNATGQVAYSDYDPVLDRHRGYFYDGATKHDIGTLGGSHAYPYFLTAAGQVFGYAETVEGQTHAFSWTQAGGMVDLGTLGGSNSLAAGVNAAGQVVGEAETVGDASMHAFSWTQAGGIVDLGTLGGSTSEARDVNAAGQVVGYAETAEGQMHAFSWTQAGGMIDLGTLGGSHSYAKNVSAAGQVIGQSYTAEGEEHGFAWTQAGGMVDLGTLGGSYSRATGINAAGQVVGVSYAAGYEYVHAFSWTQAGGMVDLNDHIPTAPEGLELYYGLAVADNGSIVVEANTGLVLLGGSSAAPVLGPITASDPAAKGSSVIFGATFTDVDTGDAHIASWSWGDGSPKSAGVVTETTGMVSNFHVYLAAGIYTVKLTLTDSSGLKSSVSRDVVVYDPSAGFVTGGGWIRSPPGAYKADETLAGKAHFGFSIKYQNGAAKPGGKAALQFHAANLNFHSKNYDWLVVVGARAQYKGTGTINGQGSYKFILTAVDGAKLGAGKTDRFRIKIWSHDETAGQDVIVYDNQMNSRTVGTTREGTQIGGGSIVIHAK